MKVGKKQWVTSAPGKKDLKQTTVDTKSKPYYILMIYGDLPVSLAVTGPDSYSVYFLCFSSLNSTEAYLLDGGFS